MTVQDITPVISYQYTGPGDYSFGFKTFKAEDLILTYYDANSTASTLVLGTDYTVTIDPNVLGGTCSLSSPSATDGRLEIRRSMSYVQETDWVNNDPLNVELLESDLDKAIMLIQEIHEEVLEGLQTGSWRNDWQNSTAYVVGDRAASPVTGNIYTALADHTSNASGTMEDDITAGMWEIYIDLTVLSTKESNAAASASAAATSAANAATSEANAATSEANAATSASNAQTSADLAAQYAALTALNTNSVPAGSIIAWMGGYFTDGINGGFVQVLGTGADAIAKANDYVGDFGYRVCDGTEYYNANSPIFDQAGRYLPNLTDDRFLMGSNIPGGIGGANTIQGSHVHTTKDHVLTVSEMPSHRHYQDPAGGTKIPIDNDMVFYGGARYSLNSGHTGYEGGGQAHNHGDTEAAGSLTDNKPQYLACLYIMRTEYPAEGATGYETFLVKTP